MGTFVDRLPLLYGVCGGGKADVDASVPIQQRERVESGGCL
jgi:hypothetical protein